MGLAESMRSTCNIRRERLHGRIMAKERDTLIAEIYTKADVEVERAITDGKATNYASGFESFTPGHDDHDAGSSTSIMDLNSTVTSIAR